MDKRLLIITQKVDRDDQLLGFFVPWLQRFARHYANITVLCLQKGQYDLPSNVRVISLGKDEGRSKPVQLFRFYRQIVRSRNEYDAVFVHMNPIWVVLGGIVWHAMHKKIVLWYTHKAVTWKLRLAAHGADVILTASPESFRLASPKVIVTGHGIDTELFRPDPSKHLSGLHLLSVGRIAPVKNYATLIRAAKLLRDEGVEFMLTFIGEPALASDVAYEKKLQRSIEELGLASQVRFVGKVPNPDLVPYYQSHSLFVHLSKTGSLDKTILEAMACGMQVVSCNDASRAFLPSSATFAEDDPQTLAAAIRRVSAEPVSPALREYVVAHHNLDRLIEKISRIT
jgi:glycosyltransferase involved in cell wall biosynthesis